MSIKILVPLDMTKQAEAILTNVNNLALKSNAEVILLHVGENPIILGRDEFMDTVLDKSLFEKRIKTIKSYLTDQQKELTIQKIKCRILIAYGPVARAIAKTAENENADFIAMASCKLNEFDRHFYQSVTARVLQKTSRPLLLIQSPE